ncbi:MAG: hypothetical protein LBE67_15915 [Kocuria palustris]|jgi:hypothetical protein|nr:hypothetical protein [Kocuria palustris]
MKKKDKSILGLLRISGVLNIANMSLVSLKGATADAIAEKLFEIAVKLQSGLAISKPLKQSWKLE